LDKSAQGQAFAKAVYSNPRLFAVASEGKVFRPLEGDTGNKAATVFLRPSAQGFYLAAFNYDDKQSQTVHIFLERIAPGLTHGSVSVEDVASGVKLEHAQGEVVIALQPAESKLIEIRRLP
jgi:alpha-galactosidase